MGIKLAIDMGTSLTNIYQTGNGIVLSEPSAVAIVSNTNNVKAIGLDAKRLVGKTAENTTIIFPVFEGEIVNENMAAAMLSYFLEKLNLKGGLKGIEAVFSVPCGADALLIEKYKRVAYICGIKKTVFAIVPVLSALGQNIPLNEFSPCFVIDVGGGTTNIAAFSLDGVIAGICMNIGGGNIDAHLIDYIAEKYSLKIGLLTAEKLKITAGSLINKDMTSGIINGRDIMSGRPRSVSVTAESISYPIRIYIDKIIEYTENVLGKLPAEVSAEIRHTGIFLSGGTAKLAGIGDYFSKKLNMNVNVAEEPEMSVVQGGGVAIGNNAILNAIMLKIN